MKYLGFLFIFIFFLPRAYTQDSTFIKNVGWGPEIQVYPTGFLSGLTVYKELNDYNFIHIRFGYNFVRHGSAGLHEDERGGGWGGTIGYDRLVTLRKTDWLLGARCDGWRNKLDWKNNIGSVNEVRGQTTVTVLQPTVRLSYPVKSGTATFLPSLAFGAEINVQTSGEEVGEGLILLLGVSYILD